MTIQSCMGGWCTKRDHCAHFHAASEDQTPSQRLCPPGHDGAGLQHLESELIDMTRPYVSADERRQQALSVLRDGISIAELREALGYAKNENATRVMDALVYAGQAFTARSKCDIDSNSKAWTTLYFRTAEARDAHLQVKNEAIAARTKARKKATACRMPYYIKRNAERKASRADRMKAQAELKAAERAQREAMKLAEAEQRKVRARLDREANGAAKQREKVEAKTQQQRLKAETKAAGQLGKQKGTASAKPATVRGPAMLPGELDLSRAKITIAPPPPDRWAATTAPSVISSRESRKWTEAVAA